MSVISGVLVEDPQEGSTVGSLRGASLHHMAKAKFPTPGILPETNRNNPHPRFDVSAGWVRYTSTSIGSFDTPPNCSTKRIFPSQKVYPPNHSKLLHGSSQEALQGGILVPSSGNMLIGQNMLPQRSEAIFDQYIYILLQVWLDVLVGYFEPMFD